MQVHIKYFASIREALGRSSETWQTSALTLGDLRLALVQRDALENHPLAALARELVPDGLTDRMGSTSSARFVAEALPEEALPCAADIGDRTISLPLWPGIPEADVDRVCEQLVKVIP